MRNKHIISILLSTLLVLSVIFTLSFIAVEADHDCCGEECTICAEIQACEEFIKTITTSAAAVVVFVAVCKFGIIALPFSWDKVGNTSLVSLKVKLSN